MPGTDTLLLDTVSWDLITDVDSNIAKATEPYSLAQDAASAIKTQRGQVYFDTLIGVPLNEEILGKRPPLALLKSIFVDAAETVPGVASAQCFIAALEQRAVSGQVQVTSARTGQVGATSFQTVSLQGLG